MFFYECYNLLYMLSIYRQCKPMHFHVLPSILFYFCITAWEEPTVERRAEAKGQTGRRGRCWRSRGSNSWELNITRLTKMCHVDPPRNVTSIPNTRLCFFGFCFHTKKQISSITSDDCCKYTILIQADLKVPSNKIVFLLYYLFV